MKKCKKNCPSVRILSTRCLAASMAALLAVALVGCRRTDVRDYTLTLPGLTEANKPQVVAALAKYGGIRKDSYVFDLEKKTLTLKYDSMQIAKTNIRMAIQDKGLEVR